MLEWWTNRSRLPSSGVMKPNPFSSLNHLTVPDGIWSPPPYLEVLLPRRWSLRIPRGLHLLFAARSCANDLSARHGSTAGAVSHAPRSGFTHGTHVILPRQMEDPMPIG